MSETKIRITIPEDKFEPLDQGDLVMIGEDEHNCEAAIVSKHPNRPD